MHQDRAIRRSIEVSRVSSTRVLVSYHSREIVVADPAGCLELSHHENSPPSPLLSIPSGCSLAAGSVLAPRLNIGTLKMHYRTLDKYRFGGSSSSSLGQSNSSPKWSSSLSNGIVSDAETYYTCNVRLTLVTLQHSRLFFGFSQRLNSLEE